MGASFTNVQVLCDEPREAIEKVRSALEDAAAEDGLREAKQGEQPDRTVILVPTGERWLGLYDEWSEDQSGRISRLAQGLSRALKTTAFSVLVHDSDVLDLVLCNKGKILDSFDSCPEFSGKRKESAAKRAKHAEKWKGLVRGDSERLREAFASGFTFAEKALEPLAEALGLDPGGLSTGFKYLQGDPLPAGAMTLSFRFLVRPAWERQAGGPPRLLSRAEEMRRYFEEAEIEEYSADELTKVQASVTGTVQLSVMSRNEGGPGRGLRVEVLGASEQVRWSQAEVVLGNTLEKAERLVAPFRAEQERWVARFPDAALPPGIAEDKEADESVELAGFGMQRRQAIFATGVHANVFGTAVAAGTHKAVVRLVPEVPGAGPAEEELEIEVRTTEKRPLRAPVSVPPGVLEPLEEETHLVALLVFDLPMDGVDENVAALVESVRPWLPDAPVETRLGYSLDLDRPFVRTKGSSSERFWAGSGWKKLRSELLKDALQLSVEIGAEEAGLEVGRDLGGSPTALPVCAFYLEAGRKHLDYAQPKLVEAVDSMASRGGLVQALVTRWGAGVGLEQTPYETAASTHGGRTLERDWVTRWLRAVGKGHVWLGPTLTPHVNPSDLAAVAKIADVGPTLRVEVRDLPAVERALAPLLADEQDVLKFLKSRQG